MSVDHLTQQKSLSHPPDVSLDSAPCGVAFSNPNATSDEHHARVCRTSSNAESTVTKRSNRSLCHTIIPEESNYEEHEPCYYHYPEIHPLKGKVYSDSVLCPATSMDQVDLCHLSRTTDMRKASEPIPQVPFGVNTPDIFRYIEESLSFSFSPSLSLFLALFLSLSLSLSLYVSISLSCSLALSLSPYLCFPYHLCLSLSPSLSLAITLSIHLTLSLTLSFIFPLFPIIYYIFVQLLLTYSVGV